MHFKDDGRCKSFNKWQYLQLQMKREKENSVLQAIKEIYTHSHTNTFKINAK